MIVGVYNYNKIFILASWAQYLSFLGHKISLNISGPQKFFDIFFSYIEIGMFRKKIKNRSEGKFFGFM